MPALRARAATQGQPRAGRRPPPSGHRRHAPRAARARAGPRGDALAVLVGHKAHRGADLVHDARLRPGGGEDGLDRLREAGQAVDAGDQDVLDAALLEFVEHAEPELRAFAVLPPDPQGLAVALTCDTEREIARAVGDRAVLADLHTHRVEVDDRVHALQRSRLPGLDVLQHRRGHARDRVAADLHAVEL